ncbi:DUF4123 domain-containing protein [Thioclava sp. SK-1]|uniref:DUF4123 domain-containing protein n=1 Tax=Thioclava sp. SK-1 TaxID=1889770 RepID=UPI00159EFCBB|nr:DUF4123 domain-containing protein [Thioclava sp. SK-1]
METRVESDDWLHLTDCSPAALPDRPKAQVTRLPITPLDKQFAVFPKRSVPDECFEALFGQDIPDAALKTYAVIDAAKITDLRDSLERTNLPHACLFKGKGAEDWGDAAPWLVEITPDDDLTRALFTKGDKPWQLWDLQAAIFLRTTAGFSDLHAHLRKFLKLTDEAGKWFFFRFWEAKAFQLIAAALSEDAALSRFWWPEDAHPIRTMIAPDRDALLLCATPNAPERQKSLRLSTPLRAQIDEAIDYRFCDEMGQTLFATAPRHMQRLGVANPEPVRAALPHVFDMTRHYGFTRRSDCARLMSMAIFYGTWFLWDPRATGAVATSLAIPSAPSLQMRRLDMALQETAWHQVVTSDAGLSTLHSLLATGALRADRLDPRKLAPFGFTSAGHLEQFSGLCAQQQDQAGFRLPAQRRAHLLLSCLYTPWFLSDPLHSILQKIFYAHTHDLPEQLSREIEKRLI